MKKNELKILLNKFSASQIARLYGVHHSKICRLRDKLGISPKNKSEISRLDSVQIKTKKTVNQKYGVDNVSQADSTKRKIKRTCIQRYGVDNVSKAPAIRKRIYKTCLEKYGHKTPIQLFGPQGKSYFQESVENYVKSLNINIETEVRGLFAKKGYSPRVDILVPSKKLVIECYGDIWHANPAIFSSDDIVDVFGGRMTAAEIWRKDSLRIKQIKSFGYDVYIVWERDWKNYNTKNLIKSEIRSKCGR